MATTETERAQTEDRPVESGPARVSLSAGMFAGARGVPQRVWLGRLMGGVWIIFLVYPVADLFQRHYSFMHRGLTLLALAIFLAIYLPLTIFRTTFIEPATGLRWLGVAALYALAIAMSLANGPSWLTLFLYCEATIGWLPPRIAVRGIAATTALVFLLALVLHADPLNVSALTLQTALVGFLILSMFRMVHTNAALRAAREEVARLAVAEERLRFARDLHDLLGHSLSLITLKSELAGQLVRVAPERAATEIQDIERVARQALREVREAVVGYRQPTLAAELAGARAVLDAAGIASAVTDTAGALPAAVDAVLAWTVREGITNVIRHSGARRCTIRIGREGDRAVMEMTDDGRGDGRDDPTGEGRGVGSGLAGLTERVAARGGWLEAGTAPTGGFRLSVAIPLDGEGTA